MAKNKFSVILYLLSSILVLILSIFIYRIITHISYFAKPDEVTISKYTGERVEYSTPFKPAKIATYINTNNEAPIAGLSSADVVFEFLSNSYAPTYKAIYSSEAVKNVSSTVNLKDYSNSFLPEFNFSKNIELPDFRGKNATSVFITFNEDLSSNFLYKNGEYYHYRGLVIDNDNNTPVKFTNVIVQFIKGNITNDDALTSSENDGTGLLFCHGVAQDIKWNRKKDSQIAIIDQNGGPVSLMPGATWWIFIDKECSVAYD